VHSAGFSRRDPAAPLAPASQAVFNPTTPWNICTPASSRLRAQRIFEASSKLAFSSTTTVTSFFSAASISALAIGESEFVRYSVYLIDKTRGSCAAVRMKFTTP
jgi:hypothetical protein